MASGLKHEQASTKLINTIEPFLVVVVCISIFLAVYGYDYYSVCKYIASAVGCAVGLYTGRRITPDIDLDEIKTRQVRLIIDKYPVMGRVWWFYWLPYALMHKHRGVSHFLIVGTIGRWLYLFGPIFPMGLSVLSGNQFATDLYVIFWLNQIIGQCFQDALHILMDWWK